MTPFGQEFFEGHKSFLVQPIPLFWTPGGVCPRDQAFLVFKYFDPYLTFGSTRQAFPVLQLVIEVSEMSNDVKLQD